MGDNMPKIKILVTIKNDANDSTYETLAITHDDIISYKEKDGTLVIYNLDTNSLVRENDELRMDYLFDMSKKTNGTITIKEYNKDVYVSILTKKIERKNNDIEVQYSIENQEFLYKIEEIK